MLVAQQITKTIQQLSEEEAKAVLIELFMARNYGNQEMIQTMNELVGRLKMEDNE